MKISENILYLRQKRGLTQAELAQRAGLQRPHIAYFETGKRVPSIPQAWRLAAALDASWEELIGARPTDAISTFAIELRNLGLSDLWVEAPVVPGSFRHPEESLAGVVSWKEPVPRILEGLPALLAWNPWDSLLLYAFARQKGRAAVVRLAWLADIALAIERQGGFPGGCPARDELGKYLKRAKSPQANRWDSVGSGEESLPTLPIWKRWRISYPANLETFRTRAASLVELANKEGRRSPTYGVADGTG